MNEKSHVSMEANVCPVCGKTFETGTLLLDKRMRNTLEPQTLTGWGMCPEHQKMKDDGFIAMIGIDPEQSRFESNGSLKPQGAHRTGHLAHIRATVWPNIFNVPLPPDGLCFVDEKVIEMLEEMQKSGEEDDLSAATKEVVTKLRDEGDES